MKTRASGRAQHVKALAAKATRELKELDDSALPVATFNEMVRDLEALLERHTARLRARVLKITETAGAEDALIKACSDATTTARAELIGWAGAGYQDDAAA